MLTACGGGGGNEGKKENDEGPGNTTEFIDISKSEIVIALGSSVPPEIASIISEIVTDYGSGPVGSTLKNPDAGSLVVAIDNDTNLLLAGYATDQNIELNAETTAIALSFIGIIKPDSISTDQLIEFIKSSEAFDALVEDVNAHLSTGKPLTESDEIFTAVEIVMTQAAIQMELYIEANAVEPNEDETVNKALSLSGNVAKTPLPYTVFRAGVSNLSINEQGLLTNYIPIAFNISQHSAENTSISGPQIIQARSFDLDLIRIAWNIKDLIITGDSNFSGSGSLELTMDQSFEIQVEQNSDTIILNVAMILNQMVSFILPVEIEKGNQKCMAAWTNAFFPSNTFIELVSTQGIDGFVSFMKEKFTSQYVDTIYKGSDSFLEIGKQCIDSSIESLEDKLKKAKALAKAFNKYVNPAQKIVSLTTLMERIALFEAVLKEGNQKATVCVSNDNKVTNCADDFYLRYGLPSKPMYLNTNARILAAGVSLSTELKALDINNEFTLLPAQLEIQPTNIQPSIDAETSNIIGIKAPKDPGIANITITDKATNKSSTEEFQVINPVFHGKDTITLGVDETKTLRLVHPDHKHSEFDINDSFFDVFFLENGLFEFFSLDPGVVKITSQASTSNIASVSIQAIANGAASITARNLTTDHEEILSVAVEAIDINFSSNTMVTPQVTANFASSTAESGSGAGSVFHQESGLLVNINRSDRGRDKTPFDAFGFGIASDNLFYAGIVSPLVITSVEGKKFNELEFLFGDGFTSYDCCRSTTPGASFFTTFGYEIVRDGVVIAEDVVRTEVGQYFSVKYSAGFDSVRVIATNGSASSAIAIDNLRVRFAN